MHGVAPHRCGQVARPLLGGGTGGRSPGLLYSRVGGRISRPRLNEPLREGAMIDQSIITCRLCGTAKSEHMRTDACRIVYECTAVV